MDRPCQQSRAGNAKGRGVGFGKRLLFWLQRGEGSFSIFELDGQPVVGPLQA
jgi:hypothetical protein